MSDTDTSTSDQFYDAQEINSDDGTGDPDDLDSRIVDARRELAEKLSALSDLLYTRYLENGATKDIREALECDKHALELTPSDDPLLAERQSTVGVDLAAIYRLDGDLELLDQSVILISKAIEGTLHTDATRQAWREHRYNLSISLNYLYQRTKNKNDLTTSMVWLEEVINDFGGLENADSDTVHQLAVQYLNFYDEFGEVEHLEKAVDTCEFALARTKQTSGGEVLVRRQEGHLSRCYHALYVATGDSAYLEQSINHINLALELTPTESMQYGEFQGHMGAFIWSRYRHRGDVDDLLRAIALERSALSGLPSGHLMFAYHHFNLGESLRVLYETKRDDAALDESIELQSKGLQLISVGHQWLSWWKHNLSNVFLLRYARDGNFIDLEQAIHLAREVADSASLQDPDFASFQLVYCRSLAHKGNEDDHLQIVQGLRAGMTATNSQFDTKLECALEIAKFSVQHADYSTALEGYVYALELLPQVLWLGMDVSDRASHTTRLNLASLAADAAACCLFCDKPELALELLEQGRSLLWSQALSLHEDVSVLEQSHPEIASRFKVISKQLSSWNTNSGNRDGLLAKDDAGNANVRGHRLVVQWNELVGSIRNLDGFSRFLQPPKFSDIRSAGQDGAIVVFNASRLRNDALILCPDPTVPIVVVRLSLVDFTTLEGIASDANRGRGRRLQRGGNLIVDEVDRGGSSVSPQEVPFWLWDNVMASIIEHLKTLNPRERLWICPTGLFTFLPMHAAYPRILSDPGLGDIFFVSYTPTISALLRGRAKNKANQSTVRLLAIGHGMETLDGWGALSGVEPELNSISSRGQSHDVLLLRDKEATMARVLKELTSYSWVHFCCHGHQDPRPMDSALHMHDGPIAMRDLMQVNMAHAQFAFLSACETATGSREMPDEAMHLAAALQFAGFPSIISSLISISDFIAPKIADGVYKRLLHPEGQDIPDVGHTAIALGQTVRRLKKTSVKNADQLSYLVPFVHIGI